ncbi:MAG: hypothetical protein LBU28_10325, partial [Spirochaetaceae bacterium]|nr:hypothetical protein [Spirochaetaceae bacterium]
MIVSPRDTGLGDLGIAGERLAPPAGGCPGVDLEGRSVVYPALINTHDHLQGNYLPRVGPK